MAVNYSEVAPFIRLNLGLMPASQRPIFYTENPKRWKRFRFSVLVLVFIITSMAGVALYSLKTPVPVVLPHLLGESNLISIPHSGQEDNSARTEIQKVVKTFRHDSHPDFYAPKSHHKRDTALLKPWMPLRSGFFVNWDIQSFESLQKHHDSLNMVLPEWMFLSDTSDRVVLDLSNKAVSALNLLRNHHVAIVPMVSNFWGGDWNTPNVHRILHSKKSRRVFIQSIIDVLNQYHFQGINLDFEEINETSDEYYLGFVHELSEALAQHHYLFTLDISPFNEEYPATALEPYVDLIFLMAYDQHNAESMPGPVSAEKWVSQAMDEILKGVEAKKVVLCLAGFGYDWVPGFQAENITCQESLSIAKESEAIPDFDPTSGNLFYSYYDDNDKKHEVWFSDAASCFNIMRMAADKNITNTAIWRLGSEDERIWQFYRRDFAQNNFQSSPSFFKTFTEIKASTTVDYIGEGEILYVISSPEKGKAHLIWDSKQEHIQDEIYKSLPTGYVFRKLGNAQKQLVLTFDDGPDADYTNRILDILEKKKVPAAFFCTGINIQANLSTFRRLAKSGMEIGNHTYTHVNMETASRERNLLELRLTRSMIEALTGRSTLLFRPPYAIDAEPTQYKELLPLAVGKSEHYLYIGSSIDTRDWEKGVKADTIFQRAVSQAGLGNIILMHDAGGSREETVKALPRIIDSLQAKGYSFVSLAQLMHKKESELMPSMKGRRTFSESINALTIQLIYYVESGLYYAFLFALILMMARLVFLTVLFIQKLRSTQKLPDLPDSELPMVSILVPAWNEEVTIVKTIHRLLELRYPHYEILVINDGSTDNTSKLVHLHFANHPKVVLLDKENGGKASALNLGMHTAKSDWVLCVDADTQLEPDALRNLIPSIFQEEVKAVAGYVRVGNTVNFLTYWQSIEYTTSQNFERIAFDQINAIQVVPGAIGLFNKAAVLEAGGYTQDTLAEDCDLTLRILLKGGRVVANTEAIAWTEAPETLVAFVKQRRRWTFGIIQSFWKHRRHFFRRESGSVAWFILPNILLFQIIIPILNPVVDLILILSLIFGPTATVLLLYLTYMALDIALAVVAYKVRGSLPSFQTLLMMIPQRILYRLLYWWILVNSLLKIVKGELQHWGMLKRSGNVQAP